ncbi:hypothetical protein DET59_101324 [Rossellomorea aquimaris]|uniref:Uncharacterized protein n=1 Tax=Rossellomorea aquimaris TaxID=189382 RepID=A0A366F2N0_9BACI|nr:hypothetical protein DET59_101324 [Rossellomorea aquimaris]
MNEWIGASALCMHEGRLLMVLQGKEEEEKRWSVPSGGWNRVNPFRSAADVKFGKKQAMMLK